MGVHGDGTGTGWDVMETLDVDQPHGLDWRQLVHLSKAVRKRINKEHVAFGDTTAGGEHIPGGCAVLDIVDGTDDVTDGWNDGTYTGGGLVYSLCGIMYVCSTLDTTYDGATDVTIVKLHPNLQWAGGDVTWAGAHEFDASVDFTGPLWVDGSCDFSDVVVTGDLSVVGKLAVDSSSDFSAVGVAGDLTVGDTTARLFSVHNCDVSFPDATVNGGPVHYGQGLIAKAWVRFKVDGGVPGILDNVNVSAVNDGGVGEFSVNWDTNFANVNYACVVSSSEFQVRVQKYLAGSVSIVTYDSANNAIDATEVSVIAFGDQ